MQVTMDTSKSYNINIGYNNFEKINIDGNYIIIIDKNLLRLHRDYVTKFLNGASFVYEVDATEENKSMNQVEIILSQMSDANVLKDTTLVAIGGGVVGDLAGFCASIYMRGIKFVHVPTTLLSQVDSSIGAKVGVNYNGLKNNIGSFYPPSAVIIDLYFLKTLSTRIFREGFVELIKHGFIYDIQILKYLEDVKDIESLRCDKQLLESLIIRSLEVKKHFVQQDPLDIHERHVLNYGHTYAHALELSSSTKLYHGECVMHGMLVMSMIDEHLNINTNNKVHLQMIDISNKFGLLKQCGEIDFNKIKLDKKASANKIKEVFIGDDFNYIIKEVDIENLVTCYEKASSIITSNKDKYKVCENKFIFNKTTLKGDVLIPPSKSYSHRYIIAASFSSEPTLLYGMNEISDDIKTTLDAVATFGAKYEIKNDTVLITPCKERIPKITCVNMHESATSLRLMLPLMLTDGQERQIRGENKLPYRPNKIYEDILVSQNISHSFLEKGAFLPLSLKGTLKPGIYEIDGGVSSQFISGLLYSLALLDGDSTIKIINKLESKSYVEMTLKVLTEFGIEIKFNGQDEFYIKGNQTYKTKGSYTVEQDYSGRTFFEVAKAIGKNDINILNDITDSIAGDREIIEIIKRRENKLDLNDMIDSAPIMALYFSQTGGGVLINTKRLEYKESNRLQAIIDMLVEARIEFKVGENQLTIQSGIFKGRNFNTHLDHRITMTLIIASTVTSNRVIIKEIKSINKSFVSFLDTYTKLGGIYDEE